MDALRQFCRFLGKDSLPPGDHPYLRLKLPTNVPLELKPSPGKGWGAYATTPIKAGTHIMRERALFVIRDEDILSVSEGGIFKAVLQLSPFQIAQFCCLCSNGTRPFRSIIEALAENHLSVDDAIMANRVPEACSGFYILHSRYNHSCVPNTVLPRSTDEWITSIANKDILPGEEITYCYKPYLKGMTRAERHKDLSMVCRCDTCSLPPHLQLLSDMRRRLIRGLYYTLLGVGLRGEKDAHCCPSPTIIDLALKRDAESFKIPLTRRFISFLLIVHLLELEGLADDTIFFRFRGGITALVGHFVTAANRKVADGALEAETSLGRFLASLELWGKTDDGDDAYAGRLREQGGPYRDTMMNLLS